MKFTLSLLVALLSVLFSCSGQPEPKLTGFKADLWVERVPIKTGFTHSCSQQQVLLIVGDDRLGIISPTDTLALMQPNRFTPQGFYVDKRTNIQYMVVTSQATKAGGFIVFITPLPHQEDAKYSLVLSTTKICRDEYQRLDR